MLLSGSSGSFFTLVSKTFHDSPTAMNIPSPQLMVTCLVVASMSVTSTTFAGESTSTTRFAILSAMARAMPTNSSSLRAAISFARTGLVVKRFVSTLQDAGSFSFPVVESRIWAVAERLRTRLNPGFGSYWILTASWKSLKPVISVVTTYLAPANLNC